MDLCAAIDAAVVLNPGDRAFFPTGLIFAIPVGFEGQVRTRSGLSRKHGLVVINSPGTVDSDYRGEVGVVLLNQGRSPVGIQPLDRIAQIVFSPVARAQLVEADELDETVRGAGGYGSTGVQGG